MSSNDGIHSTTFFLSFCPCRCFFLFFFVQNFHLHYRLPVKALRLWQMPTAVPWAKWNRWSDAKNDQGKRKQNIEWSRFCFVSLHLLQSNIKNMFPLSLLDNLITKYTLSGACSCRRHEILWLPETVSVKLLSRCSWRDWTSNLSGVATVHLN